MVAVALEKLLDYTESDISKEQHFEVRGQGTKSPCCKQNICVLL